jgi:hypothetical protein
VHFVTKLSLHFFWGGGGCGGSVGDVVAQLGDVVAQFGDEVAQLAKASG